MRLIQSINKLYSPLTNHTVHSTIERSPRYIRARTSVHYPITWISSDTTKCTRLVISATEVDHGSRSSRLLADEVNHVTIEDRPRSNIVEKHHRGSHARKEDRPINAWNRRFSCWSQTTAYKAKRSSLPSPLSNAAFLEAVADRLSPSVTTMSQMQVCYFEALRHHGGTQGWKLTTIALHIRSDHGSTHRKEWHHPDPVHRSNRRSRCFKGGAVQREEAKVVTTMIERKGRKSRL